MRYRVERLSQDNIEAAAELVCQHIFDESGEPADYESVRILLYSVNYGNGAVFLVRNKFRPFGIIIGDWSPTERQYTVRNLYVDEPHRGGPGAKLLIGALLDWATEIDAPVYIATVGEPRPFYRALGFEPTHVVSRTSLKTLRERIGDSNGERNRADHRGHRGSGADEPGEERAAAEPGV